MIITISTAGIGVVAGDALRGARSAGKATDDLSVPCPNSFTAGTLVLMADGTTKNIEEVEIGDEVLATDTETGETAPKTVTAEILTEDDKSFADLRISTEETVSSVTTTEHHPFWSDTENTWIDAANCSQVRLFGQPKATKPGWSDHGYTRPSRPPTTSQWLTPTRTMCWRGPRRSSFTIAVPAARSLASPARAVLIRALLGLESARKAPGDSPPRRKRQKRIRNHSDTGFRFERLTVRLKVHLSQPRSK